MQIRPFEENDWPAVWLIIQPVFRSGETYAISPKIKEEEARQVWVEKPTATFVAVNQSDEVVGTYYLKPNQSGPGSHVCNSGYIVAEHARGIGLASAMCEHSQREAVSQGFRAMQYNLVVSTNQGAIHIWERHGFEIVGTLPGAFQHPSLGFVDAYVMFKHLEKYAGTAT